MKYTKEFLKKNLKIGNVWMSCISGREICIYEILYDSKDNINMFKYYNISGGQRGKVFIRKIRTLNNYFDTGRCLCNVWKIMYIQDAIDKIKNNI